VEQTNLERKKNKNYFYISKVFNTGVMYRDVDILTLTLTGGMYHSISHFEV